MYIEETENSILEDDLEKEARTSSPPPFAISHPDVLLQRLALPEGGTPLTFETFVAWKRAKLERVQVLLLLLMLLLLLSAAASAGSAAAAAAAASVAAAAFYTVSHAFFSGCRGGKGQG